MAIKSLFFFPLLPFSNKLLKERRHLFTCTHCVMESFLWREQDKCSLFLLILTGRISSHVEAKPVFMHMNKNSLSNIRITTFILYELAHLHEIIISCKLLVTMHHHNSLLCGGIADYVLMFRSKILLYQVFLSPFSPDSWPITKRFPVGATSVGPLQGASVGSGVVRLQLVWLLLLGAQAATIILQAIWLGLEALWL